jgi:glucose-6-phosphate 1-dehydrogenase
VPAQYESAGSSSVPDESCLFVVFGATGDLMREKLLPALHHLLSKGTQIHLLGVSRRELDDAGFLELARSALASAGANPGSTANWCEQCLHFQSIGGGGAEDYRALGRRIEELEQQHRLSGNRVYYLALPPQSFPDTIEALGKSGLNKNTALPGAWVRLVIEKPFGQDLASARALDELVHRYFSESQVYRIDHYLGKETVQNLLVFRFANGMFESLWNRDRVERIEISVAEAEGVGGRAGYYEQAGALRDMVQNHLTQLLTLTAMEVPAAFEAQFVRQEKVKVLRSILPIRPEDIVFGQYGKGVIDGLEVPGYREEAGVVPHSETETFVALRLEIANWRWRGVPFYLRTGKRLPARLTRIVITFRCPPVSFFQPFNSCELEPNVLVITLQPDEGFDLSFEAKAPGHPIRLETHRMRFRYAEVYGPLPDAYQTLLVDILKGDQTLFVSADETEAAWQLYDSLLQTRPSVPRYPAGTEGPPEAEALIRQPRASWSRLDSSVPSQ